MKYKTKYYISKCNLNAVKFLQFVSFVKEMLFEVFFG